MAKPILAVLGLECQGMHGNNSEHFASNGKVKTILTASLTPLTCLFVLLVSQAQAQQQAQGGRGQNQRATYDRAASELEAKIQRYLHGDEARSILTPGEYTEYELTLKTDQVVIAEARSEVFDSALEILDDKGKTLATNDDRYLGDQRPLLVWRCPSDGTYLLHAKCFQNKAGGPVDVRYVVYNSYLVQNSTFTEKEIEAGPQNESFLLRMSLKKGEMREFEVATDNGRFSSVGLESTISPSGLPDIDLLSPVEQLFNHPVRAAIDGEYYVLARTYAGRKVPIKVRTVPIVDAPIAWKQTAVVAQGEAGRSGLWSMAVKKDDLIEITAPELAPSSVILPFEAPQDFLIDPKKPDTNPFTPGGILANGVKSPAFSSLPGRERDGRISVIRVLRDASLFFAVQPGVSNKSPYNVKVNRADREFVAESDSRGTLKIGGNDYWSFQVRVGDVVNFSSEFQGYSQQWTLYDPDGTVVRDDVVAPDTFDMRSTIIFSRPGRYLLKVASNGGGGGGTYALHRHTVPAREFSKGKPASGDFSDGKIHIWKFTAKPGESVWIHWTSSDYNYGITVLNGKGQNVGLAMQQVDKTQKFGLLVVAEVTDLLIVMEPNGSKASYKIELSDIPGYKRDGG